VRISSSSGAVSRSLAIRSIQDCLQPRRPRDRAASLPKDLGASSTLRVARQSCSAAKGSGAGDHSYTTRRREDVRAFVNAVAAGLFRCSIGSGPYGHANFGQFRPMDTRGLASSSSKKLARPKSRILTWTRRGDHDVSRFDGRDG